jgi:hypothetical protein
MSAGTVAADEARRLLEAETPPRTVPRRRPGVLVKQRGRGGTTQGAQDFNAMHKRAPKGRVGGGEFAAGQTPEGERAKQLQQQLKQQGLYKGAVDGIAGPQTQAALKAFQRQQGIEASGQVDTRTRLALRAPAPRSRQSVIDEEHQLLAGKGKSGGSGGSGGSSRSGGSRSGASGVDASNPDSVRKFQRDHGLKEDGVIGPQTQAALRTQKNGSRSGGSSRAPVGVRRSPGWCAASGRRDGPQARQR